MPVNEHAMVYAWFKFISSYAGFSLNVFFVYGLTSCVFFSFYRWAFLIPVRSLSHFRIGFNLIDKGFCRFKGRNVVGRNYDRCIL